MTADEFAEQVGEDDYEISQLCIRWLTDVCADHGREGQTANKLLRIAAELLEVV